jgi:hypothetical protein
MRETASNVALLAPIPKVYMPEGHLLCESQGKVALGSRGWEVFRELDRLRHGLPVAVYIYPSHANLQSALEASWQAVYIGHVESHGGAHPEGMKFRRHQLTLNPSDNQGYWAIFWEITYIHKHSFIPEGPLLVEGVAGGENSDALLLCRNNARIYIVRRYGDTHVQTALQPGLDLWWSHTLVQPPGTPQTSRCRSNFPIALTGELVCLAKRTRGIASVTTETWILLFASF